ncbi:unnamed protein product [Toxocara canis]|uniref:Uncharacterized protein n=1 Tax=Toxocara canis TaxID=6265 RepID=A0A183TW04_TOXCA|nr:unnamed protein product [Toxocara canis]
MGDYFVEFMLRFDRGRYGSSYAFPQSSSGGGYGYDGFSYQPQNSAMLSSLDGSYISPGIGSSLLHESSSPYLNSAGGTDINSPSGSSYATAQINQVDAPSYGYHSAQSYAGSNINSLSAPSYIVPSAQDINALLSQSNPYKNVNQVYSSPGSGAATNELGASPFQSSQVNELSAPFYASPQSGEHIPFSNQAIIQASFGAPVPSYSSSALNNVMQMPQTSQASSYLTDVHEITSQISGEDSSQQSAGSGEHQTIVEPATKVIETSSYEDVLSTGSNSASSVAQKQIGAHARTNDALQFHSRLLITKRSKKKLPEDSLRKRS